MLQTRYNLELEDFARRPGSYISALRDILGQSCVVIEMYMLHHIAERTGIKAISIEDAVQKLRREGRVPRLSVITMK